ncbi:MAG: hypothetical protein ACOY3P_06750 [Planctomycetota bacterium]
MPPVEMPDFAPPPSVMGPAATNAPAVPSTVPPGNGVSTPNMAYGQGSSTPWSAGSVGPGAAANVDMAGTPNYPVPGSADQLSVSHTGAYVPSTPAPPYGGYQAGVGGYTHSPEYLQQARRDAPAPNYPTSTENVPAGYQVDPDVTGASRYTPAPGTADPYRADRYNSAAGSAYSPAGPANTNVPVGYESGYGGTAASVTPAGPAGGMPWQGPTYPSTSDDPSVSRYAPNSIGPPQTQVPSYDTGSSYRGSYPAYPPGSYPTTGVADRSMTPPPGFAPPGPEPGVARFDGTIEPPSVRTTYDPARPSVY